MMRWIATVLSVLSGLLWLVGCGGSCGTGDYAGTDGDEFCLQLGRLEDEGFALAELTWGGPGEDCGCLLEARLLDGGQLLVLPEVPICLDQRCADQQQSCLGGVEPILEGSSEALAWPGCWLPAQEAGIYLFPLAEGGQVELTQAQVLTVLDHWAEGFKAMLDNNEACARGLLEAEAGLPLPGNCWLEGEALECRAITRCEEPWLGPLEAF